MPDADAVDSGFEWRVEYRVNKDGFRDRAHTRNKAEGVYRILVLGDSFVEGYGIRQDKRFSELTEAMCNGNGETVEIINAGVRGYNLAQHYIVFQLLHKKYQPDLVVIVSFISDLDVVTDRMLIDSAVVYYRPFYNLQNGRLRLLGVPVPGPDRSIFENDKLEILKRYLRGTALYSFIRITSDRNIFLKRLLSSLRLKKDVSKNLEYKERLSYLYNKSHDPMLHNREMNEKISRVIVQNISSEIKQDNGKLLIFLLGDDLLETNEKFYRKLSNALSFFYYNFAKDNDKYKKDSRIYHFKFDLHLNENGNGLVAEALYNFLQINVL